MESDIEELRKFLENKISNLRKELELYEYLLSILESGYMPSIKGTKGTLDYIKNKRGEVIAEILYTPPLLKIILKGRQNISKVYITALSKILDSEKILSKIDYDIAVDKDELREITIKEVNNDILYNKIKAGIQSILERATSQ
ncbi:hypothetical protein [Sulfuracidifex metallicus]|uniref:Uncharacterized protein n=1 Tax=Sulfuracidifex metallicus DSM 6482 = JCM 9184 TaxID=523847 RepID=A0A6A9QIB3_SULME|nr:hypothetical protein [Sulfuracidifex metallicus]MUN28726.1 hypothetical protein [Sulfuracidifex metallicus DSM 6482 = JCM 9184]WOE50754.1 hypothetical protein RQ359_002322 [Sulfuracidifex metallicus DSM 6482 = JCM 9184]